MRLETLRSLIGAEWRDILDAGTLAEPSSELIAALTQGTRSVAGVSVNESTALCSGPVFTANRILSESVASLPLSVHRNTDGSRKLAATHYAYSLLHDSPNRDMTAFAWREAAVSHVALWGNHYSWLDWDGAGRLRSIWPLTPDKVSVRRNTAKRLEYLLTTGAGNVILDQQDILHIAGLGFDGIVGYSVISKLREGIGLSLASREFSARFFANNAQPGGAITVPEVLSDEAYARLKESWESAHRGLTQAHRVAILEQGSKFEPYTMPLKDAELLATTQYQDLDIARAFRIPPHMMGIVDKAATYASVEQFNLSFAIHTLLPWCVRIEQAINKAILGGGFYAKHNMAALVRGDLKSRYDAYAVAKLNGWMSADDIRELEDMNPLPNGEGQVYMVQQQMIPVGMAGQHLVSPDSMTGSQNEN